MKKEKAPEQPQEGQEQAQAGCETGQPQEVSRLQEELKAAKDANLRAFADFENTKKRLQRDKEDFARFAAESIARDLLSILDSLSQAVAAVDKQPSSDSVVKGVHLIYKQLLALLEKEGVKRIATVGERFDPHLHEAVALVDSAEHDQETVLEELQAGFTMHGKVLRPAMVKVGRHSVNQDKHEEGEKSDG